MSCSFVVYRHLSPLRAHQDRCATMRRNGYRIEPSLRGGYVAIVAATPNLVCALAHTDRGSRPSWDGDLGGGGPLSRVVRAAPGCLTCCVPLLAAHPSQGPSPRPALAPSRVSCLAVLYPCLAMLGLGLAPLPSAADAGPCLAATAAPEAGLSGHSPEGARARRRASERLCWPFAAIVLVEPVQRLAGVKMAVSSRVGPAARNFFP